MNSQTLLQQLTPVLNEYSIKPHYIDSFGKMHRVYSDKGVFALKKISPYQGTNFIQYVHSLYQKGYNRIVPIYPTMDGRYAVLHNNEMYYLMPWLPNEEKENRNERHIQLFRELARLHTLSVKEIKINKEQRTEHYENTILQWEKQEEFLNGFIERCENQWYPSPFELLYCMYYNDISQALRFSKNKLKDWYEKTKEDEKARVVTIHGKLSTEHFLYDERGYGYFSNFENARQGSPIHDLLPFLSRTLLSFPKKSDESVDWVYHYFKYFPYKEEEMLLFMSYLAHPGPIIHAAEDYMKGTKKLNERKLVQQFQRQYWLLKNTEYVVMRIDEIERQKKAAQEQALAEAQAKAQN